MTATEIKCPNCGEVFSVDETSYAQIAKQVRDAEFQEALKLHETKWKAEMEAVNDSAIELPSMETCGVVQ